jgi:polysaccharide export outer membrane protein
MNWKVTMSLQLKTAICLLISFGAAASSCRIVPTSSRSSLPVDDAEQPKSQDNALGPDDVFDVRVYGEEELSKTFRVASDGTIDFPLLGTVAVVGMNQTEVSYVLKHGLIDRGYIKNPQVSVFFKENKGRKVSVLGEVKKEGTFPYEEGMTVVEAISIAGGFTPMARENETTVSRIVDGKKKLFHIPVKSISEGRAQNFTLQPGDIIFVPARVF